MRPPSQLTDGDLLLSDDPEAFGVFYDRQIRGVLGYFARRTGDPEIAADLAAETFASALVARRRFRPGGAPAGAWLHTIAQRRLADYHRKGRVDARVRRALEMERRPLTAADARTILLLADDLATTLLTELPVDQRTAITSHVIEGRAYGEVAVEVQLSEAAIRQRVARGLQTLRRLIGGET
jgi:RNA polymerase sigma-70 factor (ECF subfamily)